MKKITYFTAPWCVPCKVMLPKVRALAEKLNVALKMVDIEEHPEMVPADIRGVPTVVVSKDGREAMRLPPGAVTVSKVRKAVEEA